MNPNDPREGDTYIGEASGLWKVTYQFVNKNGIVCCAWCGKPKDLLKDVEQHINNHVKENI